MTLVRNLAFSSIALAVAAMSFAADNIKIGLQGPLTGGSSPMGVSMRDGAKLAVAEINAKGGVLGRKLEMIERDDEAKNERGVQIAQELINKEKVVATVGYINSGVALGGQAQTAEAFGRMIRDQFDMLYEEGATAPKVMAICLHPFAVTAPSRAKYLRQALEYILGHSGVWQAKAGDIADWYLENYHGRRIPAPVRQAA